MELSEELKDIMRPLYQKHQDDIITGHFSSTMMADWDNDDVNLLKWRAETAETGFEKTPAGPMVISEQEYFDNAVLMVAMVKAGVELAFEAMVDVGMKPESGYYLYDQQCRPLLTPFMATVGTDVIGTKYSA